MSETGNIERTSEVCGDAPPTKSTTIGSRDVPLGVLLAVAGYARCQAAAHDGGTRGCHCAEIARRVRSAA